MFINEGQEFSRKYPDTRTNDDGETAIRNMCTYLKDNRQIVINIYHSLGRELRTGTSVGRWQNSCMEI